jgi:signal transduction histidine kinase
MSIKTKITISFFAVIGIPCLFFLILSIFRGEGILFPLLICVFSLFVALGMAWFITQSCSLPLQDLIQYLNEISSGRTDVSIPERTYRESKEYASFASLLETTLASKSKEYAECAQRVQEHVQELNNTSNVLTATQNEVDRLNKVMIDRELKMIEMKTSLREARKRLGENIQTLSTPEEASASEQYTNSEQGRVAMLNLLEDLQQEKRLLAVEKAKDDAILRSIGEGIIVANSQGTITFLNENARTLLNLANIQTGTDTWEKLPPMSIPKAKKTLSIEELPIYKAVHGETVKKQALFIQNEQFPEGRWLEMTASPIMVARSPLGAVATVRDVTKEQEVDRAKTEFVSLASHQLRTPLSAINWYAEMLLAGDAGEINDEQRMYLNEVYQGNQRMVDLINSLLNVSRLELGTLAVDPEDTDVIALAQSVLNELAPQIKERGIQLTTTFDKETPHVYADPKLLRMVFQNLASNAVKYTPHDGSVSVHIAPKDEYITITVADTGLGIPKTEQTQIFSKLFRATNARESDTDGTGLGLYIVKSVVEHAGGTIRFESEEGKGTTFFVQIPKSGMHKKKGTKSLS